MLIYGLRGDRPNLWVSKPLVNYLGRMASIDVEYDAIDRLDTLPVEDEPYDEIITELTNIYEPQELTLFVCGDSPKSPVLRGRLVKQAGRLLHL